ncbi:sensor domain-containing diguanylate cyclase [Shewanella sp. cp20]|uniref:sensor domain-containing diguanylate cyclase n=1 Tax=Shewanella sp. cp20 TaxID=1521167 RepID=UPI00059F8873|nr:diguanylate cyclase [Shewanella sp. cp20]KIO38026.1 diguanylate cyclase [Shewanella sp. cp20]
MRLNHFLNILALGLLLLSFLTASCIYYLIYLPRIEEQVISRQDRDLQAVQQGIAYAQKNLDTLCYDYAIWDDMVTFVDNVSPQFAKKNLFDNAFEAANVDGFYVFNRQNQLVWQYSSGAEFVSQSLPLSKAQFVGKILPSKAEMDGNRPSVRSGLLRMNDRVVYFSNVTVMPSSGEGQVAGSLLTVRNVSQAIHEEIEQFSLIKFELEVLAQPKLEGQISLGFREPPKVDKIAAQHAWYLHDALSVPSLKITVNHDRSLLPSIFTVESILMFLSVLVMSYIAIIPFSALVVRPLRVANAVLDKMAHRGVLLTMPTAWAITEVAKLTESFNLVVEKLQRHQNYLESLSFNDPLTGIANRRSLEVFAERAHKQWREGKGAIGFIMLDIDFFKPYNDTVGHQSGDQALIKVAQALMLECRRRGELVTRYGGEEFCVVIHGDNMAQMELLAKRMLQRVRDLNIYHQASPFEIITVSMGAVLYDGYHPEFANDDWQQMIRLADEQLYKAKESGRNNLQVLHRKVSPLFVVG